MKLPARTPPSLSSPYIDNLCSMRSGSIRHPYQHLLAACLLVCGICIGVSGTGNASTGGVAVSAYPSVEGTAAWKQSPGGENKEAGLLMGAVGQAVLELEQSSTSQESSVLSHPTLTDAELQAQRVRIRQLLDHMNKQPSETDLLKDLIRLLKSPEATGEERLMGLQTMQTLVEPIDNANDLRILGGFNPIIDHLTLPGSSASFNSLRATAAHIIGTAASNNVKFQTQILEDIPDLFSLLLPLCNSSDEAVSGKGWYAVSCMVLNLPQAREAFLTAGGMAVTDSSLLSDLSTIRIKTKVVSLVMDLLQLSTEHEEEHLPNPSTHGFVSALKQLLQDNNMDLVEKGVRAIQQLTQLDVGHRIFANFDAVKDLEALQASIVAEEHVTADIESTETAAAGDEEQEPSFSFELLGTIRQTVEMLSGMACQPATNS